MFASVYDTTAYINNYALTHPTPLHASPSKAQAMDEDDEDAYINMYSKRLELGDRCTYVCTPMLGALGDFIQAMILHIREDIMAGDQSAVMGLLMRYPAPSSPISII
eukprot:gene44659-54614_t